MPSLRSVLSSCDNLLMLDSASVRVQTGLFRAGKNPIWESSETETGMALFSGVKCALAASKITLAEIPIFVFCEGPGSMLGIRTAAMALRTWAATLSSAPQIFSYRSLEVMAQCLAQSHQGPFSVIADARRDSWHCVNVDETGNRSSLHRVLETELAVPKRNIFMPSGFRFWTKPPSPLHSCDYDLAAIWPRLMDADLLTVCFNPDALQYEAPSYKTWIPEIHNVAQPQSKALYRKKRR